MEITPYDRYVTDDFLQMIKILIPYLPPDFQRMAGIYVKFEEFSNAMRRPCFPESKTMAMNTILKEMQPYLPSDTRQTLSEFEQYFEMFEMMQNININDIMQSMDFGDIGNMFQSERKDEHERMDESSGNEES